MLPETVISGPDVSLPAIMFSSDVFPDPKSYITTDSNGSTDVYQMGLESHTFRQSQLVPSYLAECSYFLSVL